MSTTSARTDHGEIQGLQSSPHDAIGGYRTQTSQLTIGLSAFLLHEGNDYRSAGVSTYVRQLLLHLPKACPELSYVAFQGRDACPTPGVISVRSRFPTHLPPVRVAWEQTALPFQLWWKGVDLMHGTVNVLPLVRRLPAVVTVHDLSFIRHPDRFPAAKAAYLRVAVKASVRRAQHVIAVSQHTRDDLVELGWARAERISVVYSAVDSSFRPLPEVDRSTFRARLFDGQPYILHVGTLEPRKNLDVLIRAFAAVRSQQQLDHRLALVGARGWMYESLFRLVRELGLQEQVRFVDFVGPEQLPLWYNCADLFVYPSAYEGFGLPVLEAMACGVPVITSASSALQELAAGACLTVEPGSQESLEVAMAHALEDSQLRRNLREGGLARASEFSWDETARATVRVYERVMEERA